MTKTNARPPATASYAVTVANVRELALRGRADLAFWRERLRPLQLHPLECEGQAVLHIGATSARFYGIRFQELVICVLLGEPEGVYLAQAFNSVRAFAWVERTFFGTPYAWSRIGIEVASEVAYEAHLGDVLLLRAAMGPATSAERLSAAPWTDEDWRVPIYLPPRRPGQPGKVFHGRLRGPTRTIPFDPDCDTFHACSDSPFPALDWLSQSRFVPREWIVRPAATHSKSKTVRSGV